MMYRVLTALAVFTLGCGGHYGTRPTTPPTKRPMGSIVNAALPYQVLDARTGRQLDDGAFWASLLAARAVCVGEDHTNPHHHWAQLEIVNQLVKRSAGAPLALGLEMIQRPFQGVLDDYGAKRIDAAALRSRVGWEERWGYDWGFYGPTIDAAVAAGAKLLALNAAREITKRVSKKGLDGLTPEERAQVPELVLDDPAHRAWFDDLMESMGGAHGHSTPKDDDAPANPHEAAPPDAPAMPSAERIYTVQVIWDETMADGAARWLAATPAGRAIILAGNGHCHDSAIVKRLERRGVGKVVSVRPVIDADGGVAEVLAKPMNDFVLVLQMPRPAP
ncbi:MAG: hypothetical protein JWP01_1649 [Myxococcales bacterium]|nr:hypothetical protein [Myxococcales bacterium]